MANFKKSLEKVLRWEGEWSNHEADKGGCTMKGITLATYQNYFGKDKTCEDLRNIPQYQVEYIYKIGYWDKIKGDYIQSQSVAELLFDMAVNSGPRTAIKKMQMLVNVEADGIVGPKTIAAINNKNSNLLFKEFFDVRVAYYKMIVQKNPSQKVFLIGWLRRLNSYKN